MVDTWVPEIGHKIRCIDNSYSTCPERAAINQVGTVHAFWDVGGGEVNRVMVVRFAVTKQNTPTHPHKLAFKEYFNLSRGAYLYFEPVR